MKTKALQIISALIILLFISLAFVQNNIPQKNTSKVSSENSIGEVTKSETNPTKRPFLNTPAR